MAAFTIFPNTEIVDAFSKVRSWPANPAHSVFLTPGWTAGVEGALGSSQRYSLTRTALGEVAGSVSAYHVDRDTRPFLNPHALLTHHLNGPALAPYLVTADMARAEPLTAALTGPLGDSTISVAPFGFTHSISFTELAGKNAALEALDLIAREWTTTCTGILYVDHNDPLRETLLERDMVEILAGADCVLSIRFDSLDEYFSSLRGNRRRTAIQERRRFLSSGITVSFEDPSESLEQYAHLQARLQEKYGMGYHPDSERAAILSVLASISEYVRVMVARREGQLLAFVMFYEKDGVLHPKMGARDMSALSKTEFVYFNIGYYSMVEYAISRGIREIRYGPEAYGAKLKRGCELRPHYWYLKVADEHMQNLSEAAGIVSNARRKLLAAISEKS